jgi:hydrogenase expression/formation protein HypC
MCLAIPMQVAAVEGYRARCTARGAEREVSLFLLQDQAVVPGDYLLVHAGWGIGKVDAEQAREVWELFDRLEGPAAGGPGAPAPPVP